MSRRRHRQKNEYFFDYSLLFVVLFLLGFGLIMIYSASSYEAFREYGDSAHYLKKQLIAVVLGLIIMLVLSFIPYGFWKKFPVVEYVIPLLLIPLVRTPLGVKSHGAYRWIKIPGLGFNIQPAEITKICMILFLAALVERLGSRVKTRRGFYVMCLLPVPAALMLYFITRNLSSALILMLIAVIMVYIATRDYKRLIIWGASFVSIAVLVVIYALNSDSELSYRLVRIKAWFHPELYADDKAYQTMQALYAIGSGGIWGKGLGQSMQKLSYIPEAQNDMIFSIICEELGLFGAIAIILMFVLLIWRMLIIATNAPDLYSGMLVVGVISHISLQAILNIAVVTNSIPNTGISLPFISYGGSSVMCLLAEMGIVFNVARSIQLKNPA